MGQYADYADTVMTAAFRDRWIVDDHRIFSFGSDAGTGEVSGTLDGHIAVQIAAGSYKQIRGGPPNRLMEALLRHRPEPTPPTRHVPLWAGGPACPS
jgi:hypothetical protein